MKYKFDDIAYNITLKRSPKKEDSLKYIGLEHLDSGSLTVRRYGLDVDLKGDKLIMKKGDVLLGKRNAYLRRAAIAPHDGLFSAHGMVLRPKEDVVDKDYFPFFVSSDRFFDEVIRISVGGLSPTVNWRDLKELEFDLPTLDQQKVLAEKLWAAYEVKQSYLKMIKATREMVQSQFIEMFGTIEEPKYPKIKLGEYTDLSWGDTNTTKNSYVTEGFLAYSAGGPDGKLNHYDFDHVGIVLSAIGADCGKTWFASGKWSCIKNTIRFWSTSEKLDDYYLFLATRSKDYWPRRGGAQPFISQGDARNCEISLPPLDIQRAFVSIYQQADKSEFELRKSIEAIDKVIKSLINENL